MARHVDVIVVCVSCTCGTSRYWSGSCKCVIAPTYPCHRLCYSQGRPTILPYENTIWKVDDASSPSAFDSITIKPFKPAAWAKKKVISLSIIPPFEIYVDIIMSLFVYRF